MDFFSFFVVLVVAPLPLTLLHPRWKLCKVLNVKGVIYEENIKGGLEIIERKPLTSSKAARLRK